MHIGEHQVGPRLVGQRKGVKEPLIAHGKTADGRYVQGDRLPLIIDGPGRRLRHAYDLRQRSRRGKEALNLDRRKRVGEYRRLLHQAVEGQVIDRIAAQEQRVDAEIVRRMVGVGDG